MSNKYVIEEHVVRAFLDTKGKARFELHESQIEPPDVIAKIDAKTIGIEVTSLQSSIPNLIMEKNFKIIFSKVEERLKELGINRLVIRIMPEKKASYRKINRDASAIAIVEACKDNYHEIGAHRSLIATKPVPEIKEVNAFKHDKERNIITFDSRIGVWGPLRANSLIKIIEGKIDKLNNSKQNFFNHHRIFDSYWLLMTIKGTWYAHFSEMHDDRVSINKTNNYERIFVFHEEDKWIKEVEILT